MNELQKLSLEKNTKGYSTVFIYNKMINILFFKTYLFWVLKFIGKFFCKLYKL
jgi:hypothetical protein